MNHEPIDLWAGQAYDEAPMPGFRPTLTPYLLAGDRVRGAVIVLPGGSYEFNSDREAEPVALRFAAAGYHAFVLRYSVAPHRHPQPLRDAERALSLVRDRSAEWRIDPRRIAVCGFSAGGHLAATLGVHGTTRPDALILSYPVITSLAPFGHQKSFANLLKSDAPESLRALLCLEKHVDHKTPPTFLWHTGADASVPVENSLLFAAALRKASIPFELHVFPDGGHGLSLADRETANDTYGADPHVAGWLRLCLEWLESRFLK